MKAGLNGVAHDHSDLFTPLGEMGVSYLGHGKWKLPSGSQIRMLGPEDWALTLLDGRMYRIWSEDELEDH
jgi:hypothetical protein